MPQNIVFDNRESWSQKDCVVIFNWTRLKIMLNDVWNFMNEVNQLYCLYYQIVECGALLPAAHVSEKAIVGHKQQRAGVFTVVHRLPSLSQVPCGGKKRQKIIRWWKYTKGEKAKSTWATKCLYKTASNIVLSRFGSDEKKCVKAALN